MPHIYQTIKNIYHWGQAHFWRLAYGRPDRGLTIYGVTGTNGKTTTCFILASILESAFGPQQVGMLTTIAFRFGQRQEVNDTKMTTLSSRQVYGYLKDMRRHGVRQVVLEFTSHALDQHRLAGLRLKGAIILNVAREHLDYHYTLDAYARAKQRIIQYVEPGGVVVGKVDDPRVKLMLEAAKGRDLTVRTFSTAEAERITTPLPSPVNQQNALAAQRLAEAVGLSPAAIKDGIERVGGVPGRMEWVQGPGGVKALIDYAVTPDALEHLYRYVRSLTTGQVFAIVGAAGQRDRGKRADMARIAASLVDEVVVTREDPWTEPEEQIFQDLEEGLKEATIPWRRIVDRRQALRWLIERAQAGDVIVATGKGAEVGMAVGKTIVPWKEREVIVTLLQEKKGNGNE